MATSAASTKKPWRYYYVMAFPYSSPIHREKLLAMREATDAAEQKEEDYLNKIADRYAVPEKNAPSSPVPGYIRTLLQQIALGVLVFMVAALIGVCRVYSSDEAAHIDRDLLYTVVGCIAVVFAVNALGWVALSWHSRAGATCYVFFVLLLCVLSGFAIDQLISLQFTQKSLQEDLAKNRRRFTEKDVEELVNGGAAPSLLHRFTLDGPTHFLRWLQSHCSFAANSEPTAGGAHSDGSAHADQMVDSLEFYAGFWRPQEQDCVDSTLTLYRKIESGVQLALTLLIIIMGIQLVLSGTLFLLDDGDSADVSDEAAAAKGKRSRKKKKSKKNSKSRTLESRNQRRRRQQQPFASLLRLLSFAIAISGLIMCALSANLFLSCDFSLPKAQYVLIGIFGSGLVSIFAGFLVSCCHLERTNFVKWLLVLLAIANMYAVSSCMALQEQLRGEGSATPAQQAAILQGAFDLVDNQTCTVVANWRAHTCEHSKSVHAAPSGSSTSNATAVAVAVGDESFDSVCQDELKPLLLATLRAGMSWLGWLVALNCLSLLILLVPAFESCTSTLARGFCNCLCFASSSRPSSAATSDLAMQSAAGARLKHASLVLQDARDLYLSTIRIKDEGAREAETAAFNAEWACMAGRSAADITSSTVVLQNEFDAIVRSLVIRRLTARCKMDVSLSISRDGKQLFAKIFASDNLLMTALCDMEYTLELADSVDPGFEFWCDKREIKSDLKVLDPYTIKQKLKLLAANNVIAKKEAERFSSESLSRVSARIHALTRAARVASGTLKCRNPHLPYAQYVPHSEFQYLYKKHPHQLEIPGNVRRSSVLRTIDCLRIARHLIEIELNVSQMVQSGLLTSFHCLHSASRFDFNSKAALASSWVFFWRPRHLPGEFEPETHWFLNQLGRLYPFRQPLRSVRDYFGECIAFYFAWLAFYTKFLVAPALAAVAMVLYRQDDPEFTISWTFYRSGHVSGTRFEISQTSYGLGLGVILWGLLFAKFWERKSVWYQLEWGTTDLDLDIQDRAGFWGERRRNSVTNEMEVYFSGSKRVLRQLGSTLVVVGLGAANLLAVVALVLMQGYFVQWGLSMRLAVLASSGCQAFLIQWNGDFLSSVAHALSEFENYQNEAAFQVSVVAKVFALQLLNTYSGLLILAFVNLAWFKHSVLFGSLYAVYAQRVAPQMNVLVQLETLLLLIFLARIASHLLSILHSYSLGQLAFANQTHAQAQQTSSSNTSKGAAARADAATGSFSTTSSSVEGENALEPYRGSYEDYTQIVVQFGLVVMFSSVFPLAPLLAFVECVLEMRLDALDLCLFFQRPAPDAAKDIGPWSTCIQILLKLSLVTIFGLVYFTADNHSELPFVQRMSAFLIATLLCWLLSEILWLVLPSTSAHAQEVQARNDFLVERYFGDDSKSYEDGGDGSGEVGGASAAGSSDPRKRGSAVERQISLDTAGTEDSQSEAEDGEASLEHYRERMELLRRLNIAMRRHDDLLPTDDVAVGVPVAQRDLGGAPEALAAESEHADAVVDDDDGDEEEEMIVGYFKPVRTAVASTPVAALDIEQQSEQQSEQTSTAPPVSVDDDSIMMGIPIAHEVREGSASASSSSHPAVTDVSSEHRPSKRASFFARIAKRDSPRASFSSSSSSRNKRSSSDSSEGLPPFSFASRRASKLPPALLTAAAVLELGESSIPPTRSPVSATAEAAAVAAAAPVSESAQAQSTPTEPSPPMALSIDIPRQYTTRELAGMDAINEATQRSQFDFHADEEQQYKPKASEEPAAAKKKKGSFLSRMLQRPSFTSASDAQPSTAAEAAGLLNPRASIAGVSHPRLELSGLDAVHEATRRNEFDFSSHEDDEM